MLVTFSQFLFVLADAVLDVFYLFVLAYYFLVGFQQEFLVLGGLYCQDFALLLQF